MCRMRTPTTTICNDVDSANVGPYGSAINEELDSGNRAAPITRSRPGLARATFGGSTGGVEALATQVFYPDMYNGTWAACPDPIDFHAYQNINLYAGNDSNAFFRRGDFGDHPDCRGSQAGWDQHNCRGGRRVCLRVRARDTWALDGTVGHLAGRLFACWTRWLSGGDHQSDDRGDRQAGAGVLARPLRPDRDPQARLADAGPEARGQDSSDRRRRRHLLPGTTPWRCCSQQPS